MSNPSGCDAISAYAALLGGTAACAVGGVVAADFSETLSRLDAVQKEIEKVGRNAPPRD